MAHTVVALLDGSPLDQWVLQQAGNLGGPSGHLVLIQAAHYGRDVSESVRPRILVALDGSAFAEAALPVAAELAARTASALSFVQVVPLAGSLPPPGAAAWDVVPLDAMVSEAWRYLREVAGHFAPAYGFQTPRLHVDVGQPWQAVADVIRDDSIQLLVMATHAHPRWRRMLLGSVTDHVLRETSIPVVLVHPHAPPVASREPIAITRLAESRHSDLVGSGAR